ncbi:hypothetical protein AAHA92_05818 [Salvia divinorum]|uniref:Uncharacterized protein n=1 Tax=Salvia divinorum TaxID=28513 RepID=A0ABD1I4L2_SALDI
MDLGHYIIKHLQRASKKTTVTLCCGGVIGSIALHLRVHTDDLVQDIGESLIDFDYFKRTGFIAVDRRMRAYLLQRSEDHYPLSDAPNTYVQFTTNWAINADVHRAAIAARPPIPPWQTFNPCSWNADNIPHVDASEHVETEEDEKAEERDEEEEAPQQDARGEGTSRPRRRGRDQRMDDDIGSIDERIGRLEVSLQQLSDRQDTHFAQNVVGWTQFHQQNADQWTQFNNVFDERWNEFRGYWQHPPPPPQS